MYVLKTAGLGQTRYREGTGPDEAEWVPIDDAAECRASWQALLTQHRHTPVPGLDCLSRAAEGVYTDLCVRAHRGQLAPAQALQQWQAYVEQECGRRLCRGLYDGFVRDNPAFATCLAPYRDALISRCEDAHVRKTVSVAAATRDIEAMMARACPPPAPPPSAPPAPPEPPAPPPMPPPAPPAPPDLDEPQGGGPPTDETVRKASPLRRWGPVVGVGLVAAVAVTAFRKRK